MKLTGLFALLICWLLFVLPVQADTGTINVNQATVESLSSGLDGIGLTKAAAIVDYRDKNGPFKSLEDLTLVKGIGWKTIEANRSKIRLTDDGAMTTGNAGSDDGGKSSQSAGPK